MAPRPDPVLRRSVGRGCWHMAASRQPRSGRCKSHCGPTEPMLLLAGPSQTCRHLDATTLPRSPVWPPAPLHVLSTQTLTETWQSCLLRSSRLGLCHCSCCFSSSSRFSPLGLSCLPTGFAGVSCFVSLRGTRRLPLAFSGAGHHLKACSVPL